MCMGYRRMELLRPSTLYMSCCSGDGIHASVLALPTGIATVEGQLDRLAHLEATFVSSGAIALLRRLTMKRAMKMPHS